MITPKPPTGNPTVQFRAAPDFLDAVRERRQDPDEPDGVIIRRDLTRYYTVLAMERARLPFSAEEAALICDALNGFAFLDGDELVLRAWWIEVEDHIRLNDAAVKWGVDDPALLVARCRTLTPGASAAVLDAASRWWNRTPPDGESIAASLYAVGLIREIPATVAWEVAEGATEEGEEWKV